MVCIHNHVLGYNVHFIEGRTTPCLGSPAWCEGCRRLHAPRWEGYLGVVLLPKRSVWVLKVTVGAYRNCPELVQLAGNLRGYEIEAGRLGQRNNSPLRVAVKKARPDIALPPVWPIQETLARLWGYSEIGHIEASEMVNMAEIAVEQQRGKGGAV